MRPRLYIAPERLQRVDEALTLDAEQSHYVCQVLRLAPTASLQIFDGCGNRFDSTLLIADKRRAVISQPQPDESGPGRRGLAITLIQGLARGDRMDWVIEKTTELGVARIVPLQADKSTVRLAAEREPKRLRHWQRIAQAACMQCGQDTLPEITRPLDLAAALAGWQMQAAAPAPTLVLAEGARQSLAAWARTEMQSDPTDRMAITVVIGPESGFSDQEMRALAAANAVQLSLGPRTLRTARARTSRPRRSSEVRVLRDSRCRDRRRVVRRALPWSARDARSSREAPRTPVARS